MSKEKEESFTSGEKSHGRWPKKKYLYLDKFEKFREQHHDEHTQQDLQITTLVVRTNRLKYAVIGLLILGICLMVIVLS